MAKTIKSKPGTSSPIADINQPVGHIADETAVEAVAEHAPADTTSPVVEAWSTLKVAMIDDAMHPRGWIGLMKRSRRYR